MVRVLRQVLSSFVFFIWLTAEAAPHVQVIGLFNNGAAVVNINGQRHLLKVGKPAKQGVRLISADTASATLEIDGVQKVFPLSRDYSEGFSAPVKKRISILKDNHGSYYTHGTINGMPIRMLVDTGASLIAMNSEHAKKLNINYIKHGTLSAASTAGGTVRTFNVMLHKVEVQGIAHYNLEAAVIEGDSPREILLGTNFLNKVKMIKQDGIMYLEEK
ncbi:retropepsin-like aspartic protease family protein [Zooshikella ganghwensis]|uniref:retropepsin-like aspartic protease family protein n=1 Tax=Zooshikella ganghwensis TaxID=202772 RepID=UPI000414BBF4|nr:TIGR02281 family clan AA aspartic protease [Zooshikella ganghwensis]